MSEGAFAPARMDKTKPIPCNLMILKIIQRILDRVAAPLGGNLKHGEGTAFAMFGDV